MAKKNLTLLLIIIAVASFVRFFLLTSNPPGLNWDEISQGYNAYSVLKTGMDQWGQKYPLFNFRAYGDYPTTLNLYLTIPFIMLFGLTEFALRLPHATLGVLTVIGVYFFASGLTRKTSIGLLAALLTALDPWYVFTSRFVLQSNLAVFLLTTAGAFFVYRDKNKSFLPLSLFTLTLSLFAYHTTRIFSPLFLVGALFIYKKDIRRISIWLFSILFLALSTFILFNTNARARGNVLFLLDQGAVNKIISERNASTLPSVITKLIYNRPVYFVENFAKNYVSYFTPRFLFLEGGTQYQFSVPGFGLIYPISLPFFYLGLSLLLIWIFKDAPYGKRNDFRLLVLWLALSPIPASLTNESYAVLRATTMLPTPEILISLGFFWFIGKLPKKLNFITILIYIIIVMALAGNYFNNYFTEYRQNYSWSWQYGYKEVGSYIDKNYTDYDKIIITKKYGEPHEYLLYYLKYDPQKYLNDTAKIAFEQSNWWWVDHFDKFWFVNDWQIPNSGDTFVTESKKVINCVKTRCLLVTSPGNSPVGWKKLDQINFLDGKSAFEIYRN